MITVQQADKIIVKNIKKLPSIKIPLQDAYGMVLREDLVADRDIPPFNRIMMDGIAISFKAWEKGRREFPIAGIQKAGVPPLKLKNANACLEVMTGAVLPVGCDCVIPYEDVKITKKTAKLREHVQVTRMQYVHARASDHSSGTCIVKKGTRLSAPQVAVAASMGKAKVLVSANPKIAAIGTGDEVISIHKKARPYQIRRSNSYVIEAALGLAGYDHVTRYHIKDDKSELKKRLKEILKKSDVLILSGGVSMGKYDLVPQVLAQIGVKMLFHEVKQRPGKPLWFGKDKTGKPVFGLPGNPVSTLIGLYRYVLPYLGLAAAHCTFRHEHAVLLQDVNVKTDRTYFLPVRIDSAKDGRLLAVPVIPHNSGDYASIMNTDGFLDLPQDTVHFPQGTTARLYRWKI